MRSDALREFLPRNIERSTCLLGTNIVGGSRLVEPFGITDAALGELCEKHVLVTAEFRLSGHLVSIGKTAINFNHLRPVWMAAFDD